MGAFVSKKPVRVHGEGGEWIDVKAKLSIGDKELVLDRSYRGMGKDTTITMGSATTAMMEVGFVDWQLWEPVLDENDEPVLDEDGKVRTQLVPFTPENVQRIDDNYPLVEAAIERMGQLNPTLTEQPETNGSESSDNLTD